MRGCSSVAPCGPDGARAVGQPEKPTATDSTQNPTSAPGLPHRVNFFSSPSAPPEPCFLFRSP